MSGHVSLHSSLAYTSRGELRNCKYASALPLFYVWRIFLNLFLFLVFSPLSPFPFCFCLSPFGLISWGRFWLLCFLDFQRYSQIRLGECWGVMDLCSTFPLLRDELSTYSFPNPLQSLKRLRTSISLVGERKGKNCQCITLNFRLLWGELLMSFTVIINQIQQYVKRIIDFD